MLSDDSWNWADEGIPLEHLVIPTSTPIGRGPHLQILSNNLSGTYSDNLHDIELRQALR